MGRLIEAIEIRLALWQTPKEERQRLGDDVIIRDVLTERAESVVISSKPVKKTQNKL